MKNNLILFLAIIVICFIVASSYFSFTTQNSREALIKINDNIICREQTTVYREYATMPLLKVLSACEAEIQWLNENNAIISYKNNRFALSLSKKELIDNQNGNNLLLPLPGSTNYYCTRVGSEIILDTNTAHNILFQLGIRTEIRIDYNKSEILITGQGDGFLVPSQTDEIDPK